MTYRNHGIFSAIADPNRRQILDILAAGEKSAGEIAQEFDISRPAVVNHLRILEENRLITIRQVGRKRVHQLTPEPLMEIHEWVAKYETFWKSRLKGLKHLIESKASDPNE